MKNNIEMKDLVNFAKNYGFVYSGSEIYGGLANAWDYGFLGVELKNNIKQAWWKRFVEQNRYNVGLDSAIMMNSAIWQASGHIGGFNDPLIDCKECNSRYRADKLLEETNDDTVIDAIGGRNVEALEEKVMQEIIATHVKCPECGAINWTDIRQFELMFKTQMGVVADEKNEVYLRPETAQGIFVNFKNVQRTSRRKLPLGIGQIGKSFRNEITPGNFIFRTREFEQMELEFFCKPEEANQWYKYWQDQAMTFLTDLGVHQENVKLREHDTDELAHYSDATCDIEYNFPFGWGELWGVSNRTDFDLNAHQEASKQDLTYHDPVTNERYLPYCIEPSVGVDRLLLAILANGYQVEDLSTEDKEDSREVLKLHPSIAPFKVAVLPLVKKYHLEKAEEIHAILSKEFNVDFDESGSIGKRYRRQDAIGTPFCISIDDESVSDNIVTIRFRDTMEQKQMSLDELIAFVKEEIKL